MATTTTTSSTTKINNYGENLTRQIRVSLAQLRPGYSSSLMSCMNQFNPTCHPNDDCPNCGCETTYDQPSLQLCSAITTELDTRTFKDDPPSDGRLPGSAHNPGCDSGRQRLYKRRLQQRTPRKCHHSWEVTHGSYLLISMQLYDDKESYFLSLILHSLLKREIECLPSLLSLISYMYYIWWH